MTNQCFYYFNEQNNLFHILEKNKKMLKLLFYVIDPTVRDNSAEALGTAWKVVSEKNILPFLTGVDAIKLAKVNKIKYIYIIALM